VSSVRRVMLVVVVVSMGLAACGSDDEPAVVATQESTPAVEDAAAPAEDVPASVAVEQPVESEGSGDEPAPAPGGGTATVTLDNGESYAFAILCNLQPQESAGSTIVFTVVSYDDPVNLDVTQFGEDSFNGAANISLYDSSTYDTLWAASSLFGSGVELTLNGSTLTGTGTFLEGNDGTGAQVNGELVANC